LRRLQEKGELNMGILRKLFGAPAVAAEGAAGALVKTAKGVADIVERWKPSEAAKHEMTLEIEKVVQEAAADARSYDPRSTGTSLFTEVVNVLVDALSRLIRPVVTILLIGGVFGWWPIRVENLDPVVLGWGEAVMVFWFGARTLFKDIPSLIKAIKEARA
jgi:hypothetical protein